MTDRLQYGTTAKVFHWLIVALLLVQYSIGWLIPDIHRGTDNAAAGKTIDGLHQAMGWTLLALIVIHVAAAMAHIWIYRDRIMQRMLPG